MDDSKKDETPQKVIRRTPDEAIKRLREDNESYQIIIEKQHRAIEQKNERIDELTKCLIKADIELQIIEKRAPGIAMNAIEEIRRRAIREKLKKMQKKEEDLPIPLEPADEQQATAQINQSDLTCIRENAKNLEAKLNSHIIGQEEATAKIKQRVRSHFGGLREAKPTVFFLTGPTGIGKTYTAKILNRELFDGLKEMPGLLQISAADYHDSHKINNLIGSSPGYVGYEDGSLLTSFIDKTKGKGVILIDEIEKGHPSLHKFLLTIMDEGKFTVMKAGERKPGMSTQGGGIKTYDCSQYIIILASNIGEQEAAEAKVLGFGKTTQDLEEKKQTLREESLRERFPPEFRNRITEVITYRRLDKGDIEKILDLQLSKVRKRVIETYPGLTLKVDEKAKAKIIDEGFKPEWGARFLERTIDKYITSEEKILALLEQGKSVLVTADEQGFQYKETNSPIEQIVIER